MTNVEGPSPLWAAFPPPPPLQPLLYYIKKVAGEHQYSFLRGFSAPGSHLESLL